MGKLTAAQCNFSHQDQIWKDYVKKEQVVSKLWEKNWGFIPGKYKEMKKEMEGAGVTRRSHSSTQSEPLKLPPLTPQSQDTTSRPFPKITSHEIGWRKDCTLEVFGRWGRPKHSIIHQLKWPNDAVP